MPGIEVLLPIGAIAFYIYDSAQLLYSNERLITHASQRWVVARSAGLYLVGRTIYTPGLLLPHRPLFRLLWPSASRLPVEPSALLPDFLEALRPIQLMVWALLLLLIAALPLVSWRYGAGPHMLAVFVIYYLVLLAALLVVFLRRTRLGLTNKAFGGLMFDVCACAPFGVNLVSKLTLRRSAATDAMYGELQAAALHAEEAPT
jgi:hypothetical protein